MSPRNIKEFRLELAAELERAGFVPERLAERLAAAWLLPRDEVVPFYYPHAMRRPGYFRMSGHIGIYIPALRATLLEYHPEQRIFRDGIFMSRHMANERAFDSFWSEVGQAAPMDFWVAQLKATLSAIPSTIDSLIEAYRIRPEILGGLTAEFHQPAWDFLLKWHSRASSDV